jgi:hypothetical protein
MAKTIKINHSMTKLLSKIPVLRGWLERRADTLALKELENFCVPLITETTPK